MDALLQALSSLSEWLVQATVQASVLAAAILLVQRALGRWLSPSWRYGLWLLVLVRLLLPAVPSSPMSLMNVLPTQEHAAVDRDEGSPPAAAAGRDDWAGPVASTPMPLTPAHVSPAPRAPRVSSARVTKSATVTPSPANSSRAPQPTAVRHTNKPPSPVAVAKLGAHDRAKAVAGKVARPGSGDASAVRTTPERVSSLPPTPAAASQVQQPSALDWRVGLSLLWLLGVVCMLARLLVSDLRLRWRLRSACEHGSETPLGKLLEQCRRTLGVRGRVDLLTVSNLSAPALAGIWRPRVLLPHTVVETLGEPEMRFVLLHELAHLKRRDVAVNLLASLLEAVHWFNPLLWYAFGRMRADRELACDEMVLSQTPQAQRSDYGHTIVKLLERFSGSGSGVLGGAVGVLV